MAQGYTYILLCEDDHLYTGSTTNLEERLQMHIEGKGANFTKTHPPVRIVCLEEFNRIDEAFYREKQIQGWRRDKKEALIKEHYEKLKRLSIAYRDLRKEK